MKLDWFIARRYLASRRGGRFLSLITWIALVGVAVGVTALVVVNGVMTGMQEDLREKILDVNAHLNVLQLGTTLRMENWKEAIDSIRVVEDVVSVAPFVSTTVVGRRVDFARAGTLWGVRQEDTDEFMSDLQEDLLEQMASLERGATALPPIVLGSGYASTMQLYPGDTLTVVAIENLRLDTMGSLSPAIRRFEITGTFTSGLFQYDQEYLYTTLEAAQELLGLDGEDAVSGLGVRITDLWQAEEVAERVSDHLPFSYVVTSWITQNQSLFSALKLEKLAMGLVLFLIVLVAAFNIVGTLVMVVADRTREIGILKSMGMTDRTILRIFMLQGLWIGVIGTTVGVTLGLMACWIIDRYEVFRLPPDVYFVDHLPVSLNPLDLALIALATVAVSFFATIYPATQASRLRPVEAIRHD